MVVPLRQLVSSVASLAPWLGVLSTRLVRINLSYIGDKWKRPSSWFREGFIFRIAMASFTPRENQLSSLQSTENSRSSFWWTSLATCAENSVPPSVSNWFVPLSSALKSLFFFPWILLLHLSPCSSSPFSFSSVSSWIDADLVAVL